jgi:putative transposase
MICLQTPHPQSTAPSTYFITFSCNGRRHWLSDPVARDALMQLLRDDCDRDLIALHAWVIMTNHVHLLATGALLSALPWAGSVKKRFAQRSRPTIHRHLPPDAVRGPFWLPGGGYPYRVWSHHKYSEKVSYIHENPVRSALCARMSQWRWSSAIDALNRQRPDTPRIAARPDTLIDLYWWNQPSRHPRGAESRAR